MKRIWIDTLIWLGFMIIGVIIGCYITEYEHHKFSPAQTEPNFINKVYDENEVTKLKQFNESFLNEVKIETLMKRLKEEQNRNAELQDIIDRQKAEFDETLRKIRSEK